MDDAEERIEADEMDETWDEEVGGPMLTHLCEAHARLRGLRGESDDHWHQVSLAARFQRADGAQDFVVVGPGDQAVPPDEVVALNLWFDAEAEREKRRVMASLVAKAGYPKAIEEPIPDDVDEDGADEADAQA